MSLLRLYQASLDTCAYLFTPQHRRLGAASPIADRMHAHLMTFCQHPRLGFLGRNLPPAALVAQAPDAVSPLTEVHQAILEALLNRGTANAFQEWRDDMQQYCAHVLERPPHKGGHGITPMQESSMAGFYSATARFISWLAKLEHKDNWLPDGQDLQNPTTWTNSRLIALKQVHQELITQHGFREWAPPPPEAGDAGNPAAAPAYNVANAGNPAAALGPVRRPLRPPQRPMRKERSMCKTANQATLTTHPPAPSFPVLC